MSLALERAATGSSVLCHPQTARTRTWAGTLASASVRPWGTPKLSGPEEGAESTSCPVTPTGLHFSQEAHLPGGPQPQAGSGAGARGLPGLRLLRPALSQVVHLPGCSWPGAGKEASFHQNQAQQATPRSPRATPLAHRPRPQSFKNLAYSQPQATPTPSVIPRPSLSHPQATPSHTGHAPSSLGHALSHSHPLSSIDHAPGSAVPRPQPTPDPAPAPQPTLPCPVRRLAPKCPPNP